MSDGQKSSKDMWNASDYLKERLEAQQRYHSDKSGVEQTKYKLLGWIQICVAAAIPVLSIVISLLSIPLQQYLQVLVGALGAVLSVCAGLQAFGQYQQLWLHHRAISESLKKEKFKFLAGCDEYSTEGREDHQRFCLLVTNVEAILGDEHHQWRTINEQGKEPLQGES